MRIVALLCLLAAAGASAQSFAPGTFARRQVQLWRSPFEKPSRTVKYLVPLAAATAVLMPLDQPTVNRFAQTPAPWATKVSRAGDFTALVGTLAGTYAIGKFTRHETTRELGQSGLLAVGHAFVLTQGLKAMTRRQRPDGSNRWSLPSGHAMTSFAMAGALSSHPRSPRWLRLAAPAAATAIALSRFGARKHYPSDLVIGGTFGYLLGRGFAAR